LDAKNFFRAGATTLRTPQLLQSVDRIAANFCAGPSQDSFTLGFSQGNISLDQQSTTVVFPTLGTLSPAVEGTWTRSTVFASCVRHVPGIDEMHLN
jgi:hypothetical protein